MISTVPQDALIQKLEYLETLCKILSYKGKIYLKRTKPKKHRKTGLQDQKVPKKMNEETKKYLKNWNTKTKRPKNLTKKSKRT